MAAALRARPRPIRPLILLAAAVVVVATSQAWSVLGSARSGGTSTGPAAGGAGSQTSATSRLAPADGLPPAIDPAIGRLDAAIPVWSANLRDDPADFVSASNLALIRYTRGRLTGDIEDYAAAQAAIRLALAAYPTDPAAQALDAVVRATLHDFAGALREAQGVYSRDPGQLQALATIGDAALELGRYDLAASTYATLARLAPSAAVTSRLAHLAQIEGRLDEASRLAARAAAEAVTEGSTGPSLAWYQVLNGSIAFQAGDLTASETAFRAAISEWPTSYSAWSGVGRTLAAEGRLADGIAAYERAIAIVPQPDSLAALGDLLTLSGQPAAAERQYATVRFIATLGAVQRQVYDRSLALFLADHGTDTARAVQLASAEIAVRKDVYGWDALAWTLLADGRANDADAAMRHALAMGTQDAMLDYHAGMIAVALGRTDQGRHLLATALELQAGFQPLQAERARVTLARLDAEAGARLGRAAAR
ncbi:MAG TPA: tetratricopeptide repeat protein [Candidatus Dormibacteraeota bacterium]|nr:tetratricopeptide repeat protein [Candidatus Dormibacteraeota bacterium]